MSIQRRLAISITFVLLVSLAVGFGLTYGHVLSKVRTEMQAALAVGAYGALNALDENDTALDPAARLRRIVSEFNGDRHLQAVLTAPDGRVLATSRLQAPDAAAPAWFYRLVVAAPATRTLDLPRRFAGLGSLRLETDAHNEVAEAWSDTKLTLTVLAVFFAMVLALAFLTIRAALRPLREVCDALLHVGEGDYGVRIAPQVARELEPLRDGFNHMAERLEEISRQNRALHEQIISVQEEERGELARDLHDDVAPFLFGVGADAAMIKQYLAKGALDAIPPRADAIAEAARHMQRHVKDALRRLSPGDLLDLGLAGAIERLVAFWAARRPGIAFDCVVTGEPLDPPLDAVAFRIVQESFSNAIRHGDPSRIDVVVDVDDERATIAVEDDGTGFGEGAPRRGFGLNGMAERVRSVHGTLDVRNRADGRGVLVEAVLPVAGRLAPETPRQDVTA